MTIENYTYIAAISDCIQRRMAFMTERHCKVLFVRFDLRFPAGTVHLGSSTEMSSFIKALRSHYTDDGIAAHYIWVREQLTSEAPHYHVVLLLNGSKIQNPAGVWAKAAEIWSRITNGPAALVHQCRQARMAPGDYGAIMIRRPSGNAAGYELLRQQQVFQEAWEEALKSAAYLAKDYSKGNAPSRVRNYGASELCAIPHPADISTGHLVTA